MLPSAHAFWQTEFVIGQWPTKLKDYVLNPLNMECTLTKMTATGVSDTGVMLYRESQRSSEIKEFMEKHKGSPSGTISLTDELLDRISSALATRLGLPPASVDSTQAAQQQLIRTSIKKLISLSQF